MTDKESSLPKHIAIIMDGNGRWAKKRGLPRTAGHRKGMEVVKKVISSAQDLGIEIISFFAFSTENWNRPKKEVDLLLRSLNEYIVQEMEGLDKKDVKFVVSGDLTKFSDVLKENLQKAIEKTKHNKSLIVNLCLNYGGRADILNAIQLVIKDLEKGIISRNEISENMFSRYLYTRDLPDPDFLIRTSGEQRISNFLLWQLSYAEFYFPKVLWPDFNKEELILAIKEYQSRNRRFGEVKE